MSELPRTVATVLVAVGTLVVLGFHAHRWRAGRIEGSELLSQAGFSVLLLGASAFVVSAS